MSLPDLRSAVSTQEFVLYFTDYKHTPCALVQCIMSQKIHEIRKAWEKVKRNVLNVDKSGKKISLPDLRSAMSTRELVLYFTDYKHPQCVLVHFLEHKPSPLK